MLAALATLAMAVLGIGFCPYTDPGTTIFGSKRRSPFAFLFVSCLWLTPLTRGCARFHQDGRRTARLGRTLFVASAAGPGTRRVVP